MKLMQKGKYEKVPGLSYSANFGVKDRLGREIGAEAVVQVAEYLEASPEVLAHGYGYVDCDQQWAIKMGLVAPGTIYCVYTQNLRNGADYQASTSQHFISLDDAKTYAAKFMDRKAKEAPKKAGK